MAESEKSTSPLAGGKRNPADPAESSVMTAAAWEQLCDVLRASGRLVYGNGVPEGPSDRAEGLRYLTRLLASGINVCMELADPEAPRFGRMIDCTMKWGLDAPDCLYLYASVSGEAAYRIHGNRGSANHIDIQVSSGHYADGDVSAWKTISAMIGCDLVTSDDGEFELFLGGERRGDNWLPLAEGAEFVLVRQYFADWEHERPADIFIERADGAGVPEPVLRTDQAATRLERLAAWIERGGALWENMSKGFLALEPNSLIFQDTSASEAHGGTQGQAYGLGNFACEADEAVIVEFPVPDCPHWSVGLADWYWQSLDYATRQGSLNCHQAFVADDGVFRGVIAHADPGVANWLDAAGHTRGTIVIRFVLAQDAQPPVMRRLPLDRVQAELPASTLRVSPAERAAVIAARHAAVLRRFRR